MLQPSAQNRVALKRERMQQLALKPLCLVKLLKKQGFNSIQMQHKMNLVSDAMLLDIIIIIIISIIMEWYIVIIIKNFKKIYHYIISIPGGGYSHEFWIGVCYKGS